MGAPARRSADRRRRDADAEGTHLAAYEQYATRHQKRGALIWDKPGASYTLFIAGYFVMCGQ
jgi:hypothetical protein